MPPFLGSTPGAAPSLMSPYDVTASEIVARFGTTPGRREILRGWLDHRAAMRVIGIDKGFQWLDGSFVEDKEPNDLDLVIFPHRPETPDWSAWRPLFNLNPQVFDRRTVKERFRLDVFYVQLDANPESLVSLTRYWLQLFSHQHETTRWKGMLRVRLGAGEMDAPARVLLDESVAEGGSP